MPKQVTVLRIFVASPSDLAEERSVLGEVIEELNRTTLSQSGIMLELVRWETHAAPGFSTEAQAVVNEHISDDYDIFIGILGVRFGTPTKRANSGTAEEFDKVYTRWKGDPESVKIMMYFKNELVAPDSIDPDQLRQVMEFRKTMAAKGGLYWKFTNVEEFRSNARIHIGLEVLAWGKTWGNVRKPIDLVESPQPMAAEALAADTGPNEDEEGFLDLLDRAAEDMTKATELVGEMGSALNELAARTRQRTDEITSTTGDDNSKRASYKRISNNLADDMQFFVERMKAALPLLSKKQESGIDAFGRAAILLVDFGLNETTVNQMNMVLGALDGIRSSITTSSGQMEALEGAISQLPRMTVQTNRAKRETIAVLKEFGTTMSATLSLVIEIGRSLRAILENPGSTSNAAT